MPREPLLRFSNAGSPAIYRRATGRQSPGCVRSAGRPETGSPDIYVRATECPCARPPCRPAINRRATGRNHSLARPAPPGDKSPGYVSDAP